MRYGGISQVYGVVDSTGVVESKGGKHPGRTLRLLGGPKFRERGFWNLLPWGGILRSKFYWPEQMFVVGSGGLGLVTCRGPYGLCHV